jgi:zinc-binding in reverse transcriptase
MSIKVYGVYFGENSTFNNSSTLLKKIRKCINLFNSRRLTLIGKAVIVNVVVLAKLWYVGSVVPLPQTLVTTVSRAIFTFIWSDYGTEFVSRQTMIKPIVDGGIGVTHIDTKLSSLRCAHAARFVSEIEATWKYFGEYWFGLQMRRFNQSRYSNSTAHAERPNDFYAAVLLCVQRVAKTKRDVAAADLVARKAYSLLLPTVSAACNVTTKFRNIDFPSAWKALATGELSPWARNLAWRVTHQILPINHLLFKRHVSPTACCVYCAEIETVAHCLFSCVVVRPVWYVIEEWMSALTGHRFVITSEAVIFLQNNGITDTAHQRFFHVVCSELKVVVWFHRNSRKFDKLSPTTDDIQRHFKHNIRNRITADFHRLDRHTFSDRWCIHPLQITTLNDNTLILDI